MATTIHPTAIVDAGAVLGEDCRVWHFVHISAGARIGGRCSFGQNCYVGGRVTIGDNVRVQNNVSVYEGVTLEDGVFCGPSCVFTNVYNPRAEVSRRDEFRQTVVRRGATIGANATIVCGVTLGEYAFAGAGARCGRRSPLRARTMAQIVAFGGLEGRIGEHEGACGGAAGEAGPHDHDVVVGVREAEGVVGHVVRSQGGKGGGGEDASGRPRPRSPPGHPGSPRS